MRFCDSYAIKGNDSRIILATFREARTGSLFLSLQLSSHLYSCVWRWVLSCRWLPWQTRQGQENMWTIAIVCRCDMCEAYDWTIHKNVYIYIYTYVSILLKVPCIAMYVYYMYVLYVCTLAHPDIERNMIDWATQRKSRTARQDVNLSFPLQEPREPNLDLLWTSTLSVNFLQPHPSSQPIAPDAAGLLYRSV